MRQKARHGLFQARSIDPGDPGLEPHFRHPPTLDVKVQPMLALHVSDAGVWVRVGVGMVIGRAEGGEEGRFLLFDSCVGVGGRERWVVLKEFGFEEGKLVGVLFLVRGFYRDVLEAGCE